MAASATPIVGTAYVLTSLSFLIILSRTIFRSLKHEAFKPDDYLMLASTAIYAAYTGTFIVAAYHGTNFSQTSLQNLKDDQIEYVVVGSQALLLSRIFYVSYLWTLKLCLLIYCYLRLPLRPKEVLALKMAGGSLAGSWIACMVSFFSECVPFQLYWQMTWDPPICARAIAAVITTEATNIFTDLILMAIPLPILLRPVLPRLELIRLCALYFGGILVVIVAFVRAVAVLTDLLDQHELIYGQIECFLATAVVNAPVLHGIYRHGCSHVRIWKFGRDHCALDYDFAAQESTRVRSPAGQHLAHEDHQAEQPQNEAERTPRQEVELKPTRFSATRASLRKSVSVAASTVKRLSDQLRSSFETRGIEIKRTIMQEEKYGEVPLEPTEEDPSGFDIYTGPPPLRLAHVSTQIFTTQELGRPKQHRHPRLHDVLRPK